MTEYENNVSLYTYIRCDADTSYNNVLYYCDDVYITSLQVFDDPNMGRRSFE